MEDNNNTPPQTNFYDEPEPSTNTEARLQEAKERVQRWWGLQGYRITAKYGKKEGSAAHTEVYWPAIGADIFIDPISLVERCMFHEMAHVALQPAITTALNTVARYLPETAFNALETVLHDHIEEFMQRLDGAVALMKEEAHAG